MPLPLANIVDRRTARVGTRVPTCLSLPLSLFGQAFLMNRNSHRWSEDWSCFAIRMNAQVELGPQVCRKLTRAVFGQLEIDATPDGRFISAACMEVGQTESKCVSKEPFTCMPTVLGRAHVELLKPAPGIPSGLIEKMSVVSEFWTAATWHHWTCPGD